MEKVSSLSNEVRNFTHTIVDVLKTDYNHTMKVIPTIKQLNGLENNITNLFHEVIQYDKTEQIFNATNLCLGNDSQNLIISRINDLIQTNFNNPSQQQYIKSETSDFTAFILYFILILLLILCGLMFNMYLKRPKQPKTSFRGLDSERKFCPDHIYDKIAVF